MIKDKLKEFMTIKLTLQRMLEKTLGTEEENKYIQETIEKNIQYQDNSSQKLRKHHKVIKTTEINIHLSVITLNVNGLRSPNKKKHKLANWIKAQDPSFFSAPRNIPYHQGKHHLE